MNEDDAVKTRKELLWGLHQEYRNHARHTETMKANITSYLIAASAGLISLVSSGGLNRPDLALTCMLIAVGLLGAMFSDSHTERYRQRAVEFRGELDSLWFGGRASNTLAQIRKVANEKHEEVKIFTAIR